MLLPGWGLLVPLAVFLFSPLTLEASSWWAVGINMLPMQLAMVLSIGATVKYIRTRRRKHLVTLALSVLLGLLFFEKALLTVALVFLVALCLYAPGGPLRAIGATIRRWWPAWTTLTLLSLLFLAGYLSVSTSSLRRPSSVQEVVDFVTQMFGTTLIPGLLGGPWSWFPAGDGAPITAPTEPMRWVALALMLTFVAWTVWLRGAAAGRAWLLVLLYTALVAGLLGATRMGSVYSAVAGAVPRYIADVIVVAAIAIGVALCGLRREGLDDLVDAPPRTAPVRWAARPALLGVLAALLVSATVTGVRFGDEWSLKAGRDYLANARADLARAPAGTVFMDEPVPESVVGRLSHPYNMQSEFFAPLKHGPVFVTQAREVSVFDDEGHIRPGWVRGVKAVPGPLSGCGYQLGYGKSTRVPLADPVNAYWHVVRIAYLADRDTSAQVRIGIDKPVAFDVRRGLNAMFLIVWGSGADVRVDVLDKAASVCSNEIAVGELVPAPVS
jgi:hypothetical protein